MKIYKECARKPYSFLTIDTTLSTANLLHFRKIFKSHHKMTLTDKIKILDNKIKANQAQYNLDREAAKISAFPDKYEYLTGQDLG